MDSSQGALREEGRGAAQAIAPVTWMGVRYAVFVGVQRTAAEQVSFDCMPATGSETDLALQVVADAVTSIWGCALDPKFLWV